MKNLFMALVFCLPFCSPAQPPHSFDPDNLERYIAFRANHDRFSGVTMIYEGDKRVFETIHGLANRSWNIPNTADTRFNLASVTKMFTAAAIGILHDRNHIQFDQPFARYYPDFPVPEIANRVTVRQLLSHTSGISDLFFEKAYLQADRYRLRNLEHYDRFYRTLRIGESPVDRMQ
ncbi:MAG: serine hydrolase domain-containing protein, partial [Balneolaceae bacterium]|nr:serine hydrolase domain-containing protein [Balneolaceae bacterium]